jgi:hypothetical protein
MNGMIPGLHGRRSIGRGTCRVQDAVPKGVSGGGLGGGTGAWGKAKKVVLSEGACYN